MFLQLKESRLTFTDCFIDNPVVENKENTNMNTLNVRNSKYNLYEYLKCQKSRMHSKKQKSTIPLESKTLLSNKSSSITKNVSKLSREPLKSLKASVVIPVNMFAEHKGQTEGYKSQTHRTAVLDSRKTDTLSKLLNLKSKDASGLTYRCKNTKSRSFMVLSAIKSTCLLYTSPSPRDS